MPPAGYLAGGIFMTRTFKAFLRLRADMGRSGEGWVEGGRAVSTLLCRFWQFYAPI